MSWHYLDWWALAAWCGINIVVPVILPLLVLWLFARPPTTAAMAGRNVLKAIGKGELFWAAMAMSAASCYELYSLQKISTGANLQGMAWLLFWGHQFLILFSVIFVGIGSLSSALPDAANPHIPDPTVFGASIGVLMLVVIAYPISHALLMVQEAELKDLAEQATTRVETPIIRRFEACLGQAKLSEAQCVEQPHD